MTGTLKQIRNDVYSESTSFEDTACTFPAGRKARPYTDRSYDSVEDVLLSA